MLCRVADNGEQNQADERLRDAKVLRELVDGADDCGDSISESARRIQLSQATAGRGKRHRASAHRIEKEGLNAR